MKRYEASEWTILARPVITAHDRHEWALRVREGHDHDDIPVGHDAVEVVPAATLRGAVREALQRAAADLRSVAGRAEGPGGWYAAAHHIEKLAAGWGQ